MGIRADGTIDVRCPRSRGQYRQRAMAAHAAVCALQISDMPPEWKMLFKQAGIRKRDLHDAETLNVR